MKFDIGNNTFRISFMYSELPDVEVFPEDSED